MQLLCLIDKGQDACRYLQTYGEWQHSVWLAKSTLDERDAGEVFSRWADHLTSVGVNQKVGNVVYGIHQCMYTLKLSYLCTEQSFTGDVVTWQVLQGH